MARLKVASLRLALCMMVLLTMLTTGSMASAHTTRKASGLTMSPLSAAGGMQGATKPIMSLPQGGLSPSLQSGPKVVPSPSPGSANNVLTGIETISATNIWAVGFFANTGGPVQTLILHWNGRRWRVIPSPNPGSFDNELNGIDAVSATNIWAVGFFANTGGSYQTLIEHWNGTSWSVVPSPSPGSAKNVLNGIDVVSATNIWTVGSFANTGSSFQTLIEHWNGVSWSVVSSPSPGSAFNTLTGIDAVSATDIWAAGDLVNTTGPDQTLIEHWNGTSWSVVPSPSPGSNFNRLRGIEAVSATNIWAVGSFENMGGPEQTLVEHWDGVSWSVVPSPNPGSALNRLNGIEAVSATNIWAVGLFNIIGPPQTLIEKIV